MADFTGLADLVAAGAAEHPDAVVLTEASGRSRTWAELDREVTRWAAGLGAQGMVAGYRVAVVLGNRLEFVTAYLGTLRAQAVAVPVNPRSSVEELTRLLADCGARLVVTGGSAVDRVREAVERLGADGVRPLLVVLDAEPGPGELGWDGLLREPAGGFPSPRDPESLAVLLYTSGTSGRPRGAMLSHRALLGNLDQIAAIDPAMVGSDDVVLGVLPLFHVFGLNAVLGVVLRQRARLVLQDHFEPQGTLELVEDEAVSVLPVAPPVLAHWVPIDRLEERLGPVRLILCGSAPLGPELADRFTRLTGIPVHQGYGLTEASPALTSTLCSTSAGSTSAGSTPAGSTPAGSTPAGSRSEGSRSAGSVPSGSVGAALPGVRLRVVDDDGRPPEAGDPGEILVAGANLFSGYWPDGADGPGPDGWWATGDVGFLDPDGDLYLVDRVKELVIVSGFNVYPSEVEDAIAELDEVAGVAVVGVADELTGEAVVAYVTTAADARETPDELVERIRSHCAFRLARFKQPARVEVVDALPLTVTGKVRKGRLRAAARQRDLTLLDAE